MTRIRKFGIALVAVLTMIGMAQVSGAVEVGGVMLPDKIQMNGEELVLNGAGVREKYFIGVDVYAAGLYLRSPSGDAEAIMQADEPMGLKIHILTGLLDSEKFTEATLQGFKEATNGNTAPIQDEIDQLLKAFSEEINKGDVFDIQYVPAQGVKVFKNGRTEPEMVVRGMPIKAALFGIWLSHREEKHLQELRKDLLGQ